MLHKYLFCNNSEQKLAGHIMQVYPHEGCGILLGRGVRIEKIKPADNLVTDEDGRTHFKMDPLTIYKEEAEAQKEGLEVIGFYHSHPDRRAILSKTDEEYMIPEMLYIVVSVTLGAVREIKAYYRNAPDGRIKETEIDKEEIQS